MVKTEDNWARLKEAIPAGALTLIAGVGERARIAAFFAAHGIDVEVAVLDLALHRTRANALAAAVAATRGEWIFLVDGDGESSLSALPRFAAEMVLKGADVVIGSKRHPESQVDYPLGRRLSSAVYHALVRLLVGVRVSDTRTGLRLYRRPTLVYALERALVKTNAFDLELLAIAADAGAVIAEAPVVDRAGRERGDFRPLGFRATRELVKDTLAIGYRRRILGYYAKCLVPKPLDHEPLVSVVIACPRPSWMLDECLRGLKAQTYPHWEAIILPDGEERAGTDDPRFRVIATGKVRPAEKRNLGIREAKGEIVAFIDDDAYPEPHWLEYAVKYFGEDSIGAVGGPGVTPPGDRYLAQVGGEVYDNRLVSGSYRYRYKAGGVRMDVEDYPSCNLLVRRDLLVRIGGYRTDFWPGEDTLLCKDILDHWRRIVYDPWVIVYHHRRPLFLPHLRQLGRYGFHRGYFVKRFPSNSLRAAYFAPTVFVAYVVALGVAAAVSALPRPYLAVAALPLAAYLAAVTLSTATWRLHHWLFAFFGVIASHLWYGIQFFRGLCARKAPCEFIGGDHRGGEGTKEVDGK